MGCVQRAIFLILFLGFLCTSHHVNAQGRRYFSRASEPVYEAWFEARGYFGDNGEIGQGNLFLPLAQNGTTLLFLNLDGLATDYQVAEGTLSLGLRKMTDAGWVFGGFAGADVQWKDFADGSGRDNEFDSFHLGLEAFTDNWELRANYSIPDTDSKSSGQIINGFGLTTYTDHLTEGGDVEVGARLCDWCCGNVEWWAVLGYFSYDHNDNCVERIAGPYARTEVRLYDLPLLGTGSRVVAAGQYEWDEVRDHSGTAMIVLRIPLGDRKIRNTVLERRMLNPIRRGWAPIRTCANTFFPE